MKGNNENRNRSESLLLLRLLVLHERPQKKALYDAQGMSYETNGLSAKPSRLDIKMSQEQGLQT